MTQPSFRLLIIACSIAIQGCSDAPVLRQDADRSMPVAGPVAAARTQEAAAVAAPKAEVKAQRLPDPLSYDACVGWTLEHNRDLRQQISSAERARLGVTVARSQVYAPQLVASTGQTASRVDGGELSRVSAATTQVSLDTNAFGFTLSPYAKEVWTRTDGTGDTPYTGQVGLTLSRRLLALYETSRQNAPLTEADRAYAQSVNALTLRIRRIAAEAGRDFLALQQAEARMHLRENRAAQAKAFLASVRESVAAGLKAPVEETNAVIDYNQSQADLLSDRKAVDDARDVLMSLLDQPLGENFTLAPLAVDDSKPELPPIEDDVKAVLDRHEDIANLRIDLDRAIDAARFQSDNTRPDLTGTLSAYRQWTGTTPGDPTTSENVVAVGVNLAMPLDAWNGDRAKLAQLERQSREARIRIRTTQVELERSVRELRRRIDQLVTGVDLAKQRQAAETDKYNATKASYDAGRVDNLELTRARQSLDQAEVDLIQSRINLLLALSDRRVLLPPPPEPAR